MFLSQERREAEAEPEPWTPAGAAKDKRDGKKTAKLPETPKTAEEMWQHSVIGDYLAKYRVRFITNYLRNYQCGVSFSCDIFSPLVGHVTCSTERPQEGPGRDGGGLEVDGEEGEDPLDQEGGGGPEALRGSVPTCGQ